MTLRLAFVLDANAEGLTGQLKISAEQLDKLKDSADRARQSSTSLGTGLGQTGAQADRAAAAVTRLENAGDRVTRRFDAMRAALAGLGLGAFIGNVVNAEVQTQKLAAQMEIWAGSSLRAARVTADLTALSARTAASLSELQRSWIDLRISGVQPTMEMMEGFANLAAGTGKTIGEVAGFVTDAVNGQFRGLKQIGVQSVEEIDRVTLRFQGMTATIAKQGGAAAEALSRFGNIRFAGRAAEEADRLENSVSNIRDAVKKMAVEVGEGGVGAAVQRFAVSLQNAAGSSDNAARSLGQLLGGAIDVAREGFEFLNEHATLTKAVLAGIGFGYAAKLALELGVAVTGLTRAMIGFNDVAKKNPIVILATIAGVAAASIIGLRDAIDSKSEAERRAQLDIDSYIALTARQTNAVKGLTDAMKEQVRAQLQTQLRTRQDEIRNLETGVAVAGQTDQQLLDDAGGDKDIVALLRRKYPPRELGALRLQLDAARQAAAQLEQQIAGLDKASDDLGGGLNNLGPALIKLLDPFAQLQRTTDALEESYLALMNEGIDAYENTSAALKLQADAYDKATAAFREYKQQYPDGKRTFEEFLELATKEVTLTDSLAQSLERARARRQSATQAISAGMPPLERYVQETRELHELLPEIAVALQAQAVAQGQVLEANVAMAQAQEIVNRLLKESRIAYDDAMVEQDATLSRMRRIFESFAGEIEDDFKRAFKDSFSSAEDGFQGLMDAFGNLFKSMLAELAYQALAAPIIVPVLQSVGGALGLPDTVVNRSLGLDANAGGGVSGVLGNIGTAGTLGSMNLGAMFASSGAGQALGLSTAYSYTPAVLGEGGAVLSGGTVNGGLSASGQALSNVAGVIQGAAISFLLASTFAKIVGMRSPTNAGIGAAIGYAIGGPIGGIIGSLAGLIGPKPSDKTQSAIVDLNTGGVIRDGASGSKFSAENRQLADKFAEAVGAISTGLQQVTGGKFLLPNGNNNNVRIDVGDRDGIRVEVGDQKGTFKTIEEAVKFATKIIADSLYDIAPEVQTALRNIDWSGDIEEGLKKVEFAANFRRNIEALSGGSTDIKAAVAGNAAVQVQDALTFIREFKATTAELGLDTNAAAQATREFVERLVGLRDTVAEDTEMGRALKFLEGQFSVIGPLLTEVGLSADMAGELLARARTRVVTAANDNLDREIRSVNGRGFINDLFDVRDRDVARRRDIVNGLDPARITAATSGAALGIITGAISGARTLADATKIVNEIKSTFADFPLIVAAADQALITFQTGLSKNDNLERIERAGELLNDALQVRLDALEEEANLLRENVAAMDKYAKSLQRAAIGLDLNSSTTILNPMDQLALAQAQFGSLSTRARAGDKDALEQLEGMGVKVVELARQVYGSTTQFASIQIGVKDTFNQVAAASGAGRDIARQQLTVLEAQLAELRKLTLGTNGSLGAGSAGLSDLDALNQSYGLSFGEYMRTAGNTEAGFVGSTTFSVFETALINTIGRISDVERLKSDLAFHQGRTSDPVYGASSGRVAGAIQGRLRALGVPGYRDGGMHGGGYRFVGEAGMELEKTGPARYHSAFETAQIFSTAAANSNGMAGRLDALVNVAKATTFEAAQTNEILLAMMRRQAALEQQMRDVLDRLPRTGTVG
jgi:TolA-binding protein